MGWRVEGFGFLVRLIDLMAVVQNRNRKTSNLPHACALADEDVVAKWEKTRVYFYLFIAFG